MRKAHPLFPKKRGFFWQAENFSSPASQLQSDLFPIVEALLGQIYVSHFFQLIQFLVFSQWRTPTSPFVLAFLRITLVQRALIFQEGRCNCKVCLLKKY